MPDKKISQLTNYPTPLDADIIPVVDIANNTTKKVTWVNFKATLKTYFDTLYQPLNATLTSWAAKAVPSGTVVGTTDTQPMSAKRITKRVVVVTQSATPTANSDNADVFQITGLAQAITNMTTNLTGTPVAGDVITYEITDDGTARAITWGTKFESSGTVTLPATTVVSTLLTVVLRWNATTSKWRCVGAV